MNRFDGYARSADAIHGIYQFLSRNGVRFLLGSQGSVRQIIYKEPGGEALGLRTADGEFHPAGLVIVAAGAGATKILPASGRQIVAKAWSVAHILLSDEEASFLRGIPVTYARDLAFFFEPDPDTSLLKICPMGGGYTNTDSETGVSHRPSPSLKELSELPSEDEERIRKMLAQTLPSLRDRPLVRKSLCWFADTNDSEFVIDYVPGTEKSVIVLSGDSGHGFKMFPVVGGWIRELLDAGKQEVKRWRWKSEAKGSGNVSWRLGESREIKDVLPSKL